MCKISFERCISLVFLIISLVVLICSGIPIDNADMSLSSKQYFSSTSSNNIFLKQVLRLRKRQDRVRHFRAQTRDLLQTYKKPTGHIEATVYQNPINDSPITSELTIPMSLIKPVRSQRSSGTSRHRGKSECQNEHYSMKAYKSEIVLRVKVQGIERTNYTVSFCLSDLAEHRLKVSSSFPIHKCFTLQFSNRTGNCRTDHRGKKNLVKADIKVSEEYIVFLNITGANKFSPTFSPERISQLKKKHQNYMMRILKQVCDSNKSKLKPTTISKLKEDEHHKDGKRKIKLICRASGLPVPTVTWSHNNRTLTNNSRTRIHYVKRRNVLVIRNPTSNDYGRYECNARGADESHASKSIEVIMKPEKPDSNRKPCEKEKRDYCISGSCFTDLNDVFYCECASGYKGERCEQKAPTNPISSSRYHEQPTFACNLGVATKYFCRQ